MVDQYHDVQKSSVKQMMYVELSDLNLVCHNDLYPLPNINWFIDGAIGYKILNFMDAYSGYN